jgi:hypothetical protein
LTKAMDGGTPRKARKAIALGKYALFDELSFV